MGLGLFVALSSGAQDLPSDPEGTSDVPIVIHDRSSVSMVLVPVVAKREGDFVTRLQPDDLRLWVDSRPIPIETFQYERAPLSVVILQDLSGSMAGLELDISRAGLHRLLDGIRDRDELAVATFAGGNTRVEVPFTTDRRTLEETLAIWDGFGTTGLYDAVAWLPHLSMAATRRKRAALLITDGVDNASEIPPAEAREIVRRAELPVYVLGLETSGEEADEGTFRYSDLLENLAEATGGRYHSIESTKEAEEAIAEILEELRRQYVLGFSILGEGLERYRRIEVTGRGRAERAELVHRRGYRGTRPAVTERSRER
ncbi:MAG: VWA domain-containing protein [Thermoanaerobaculia bacterium]|nr:VWA domain-containing protein [Thermoanaerobaculia bacterium]